MNKRIFALTACLVLSAAACGSRKTGSSEAPAPLPTPAAQPTTAAPAILSNTAFVANHCSKCHGAQGEKQMNSEGVKIKNTDLSQDEFISIVRKGVQGTHMPAFSADKISDAQIIEIRNELGPVAPQ